MTQQCCENFQGRIAMTSKTLMFNNLVSSFLLIIVICAGSLCASSPAEANSGPTSAAGATDVRGTWSGTFFPKHTNVAAFTITVVISQDAHESLIGSASLNSDCLKDVRLQVTVTGPKVVLAGSNEAGHNITVRGTLDKTGTLLKSTYILNGSATGSCETDNGSGTLAKQ
jgi:hypothetical protein